MGYRLNFGFVSRPFVSRRMRVAPLVLCILSCLCVAAFDGSFVYESYTAGCGLFFESSIFPTNRCVPDITTTNYVSGAEFSYMTADCNGSVAIIRHCQVLLACTHRDRRILLTNPRTLSARIAHQKSLRLCRRTHASPSTSTANSSAQRCSV